jgi:hypothetical protein
MLRAEASDMSDAMAFLGDACRLGLAEAGDRWCSTIRCRR